MTRYGIVLGAFAGLVVFLSNIPESGVLRAFGFGAGHFRTDRGEAVRR